MEQSILTSTKKLLQVPEEYDVYDLDILTHINAAFGTLHELGIGPLAGFTVEDASAVWEDFLPAGPILNSVKSFVHLKVRLIFDPPQTSYLISAVEKQIEQLTWRINTAREETSWVNPNPPPSPS